MNKLLFVINPISGGVDKTDLRDEIESCCKASDLVYSIINTTGENDNEKINEKIEEFRPSTVVACGGDGTINLVGGVLIGKGINLGIIPFGSANGLARELLIPTKTKKAIEVIARQNVVNIDVLQINNKHLSLHLSDVGFNAKLIKHYDRARIRGKLAYALQFIKLVFKRSPKKYSFTFHRNCFKKRAEMVVFANASRYGTGAVVNPDGCLYDRQFEVCIFKPYPWHAVFILTFDFFTGRMKKSRYVRIISTDHVLITTKYAVPLQIDGELIGHFKSIEVNVAPEQLPVIVPDKFGS